MRKLFLDDCRNPPDSSWDVVRSYNEFTKYIEENGVPELISFDHDLAFEHYPLAETNPSKDIPYNTYEEKTGYDCAKWLIERSILPDNFIVHSMNPVGAQNIRFVMNAAYKNQLLRKSLY